MKHVPPRVLVLGNESRSTLTVVRSLGKQGIGVSLGIGAGGPDLPAHSKYASRTFILPAPENDLAACSRALCDLISQDRFDLVIPTTDTFMIPLIYRRERVEKATRLAIPPSRAFFVAYDKFQTAVMASELGIPHPPLRKIEKESHLTGLPSQWRFPLVLKPRHTKIVWNNRIVHFPVKIFRSRDSLAVGALEYLSATSCLVQPFFHGTGCGVEVLCLNGEVLVLFQHERIHEPLEGGGSSYRKSVPVNPALAASTKRLMERLQWNGVAMVEYLLNEKSGEFTLVEINGRFWGSLPLAVHAGADFPYYLFQMMVENRKTFPRHYRIDLFSRNTSRDFWWALANLKADRTDSLLNTVPLKQVLWEFSNLLRGREKNDTLELRDPVPGLLEIQDLLKIIWRRGLKRVRRACFSMKADGWGHRVKIAAEPPGTKKQANAKRILFVCKGNICRSPFAERYFRRQTSVLCESVGYYPIAARRPPRAAILAAEEYHVDLSTHRSQVLDTDMMCRFDLIFVMDTENWLEVVERSPEAKSRVVRLSRFRQRPGPADIQDPYGRGIASFRSVYADIADCIDGYIQTASTQPFQKGDR